MLSDAPDKSRVFPYLWVDTESKSRLTIQDRKSYGASEDYVNVPTPPVANERDIVNVPPLRLITPVPP